MMKNKKEEIVLQDVTLPNPELSRELDTKNRQTVYSFREAIINILLSEKKFEYVKTSILSGIMIFFNMVISTRLIFLEAKKERVDWEKFSVLGVEGQLPAPFYIFVIMNIINFCIIYGAKLIERHFNKKDNTNG